MYRGDFINNQFVTNELADGEIKDICPARLDDEIGVFPFFRKHVFRAVEAARRAYPRWAQLTWDERKGYLLRLKEVFIQEADRMALAIARDTGKPLWEAKTEAQALISKIDITYSHSVRLIKEEKVEQALPGIDGYIRYKPRGVMAVIGPFNFPAHLPNGHVIPALAMGNTVVFKPSEQTPYVGQVYAECFEKARLPDGVFNMIQGDAESGRALVLAEEVDGVLFTGSYEVGLKIKQETLTHYWKILALEMGGKNATVVWEDAPLEKAIYETLIGSYLTAGQRCSCTSRILLHERIADQFIDRFYQLAKKLTIGYYEDNPFMGPLISEAAIEKYLRFQEIAKRENCESLMRGKVLENTKYKGYYVTPSINLVQSFNRQSIYQKSEIFGPNVAIYRVRTYEETVEIVNATGYGLVAALFTKDRSLYQSALLDYKVGLLNWNRTTNGSSSKLPFGGMLKSGNDRPSADFAIQYCSIPVACLEDMTPFDRSKLLPGVVWD
ncbi:MAG: succinylglutamate-semialdehyde dehydrogenase [Bdellovibrionaceae bacterium]|nr:succinylglutamate-semialdehyde dehydrogenase [Pseudobdellovibrionaceae bacterium]MDW8189788.1 succinylglutamate-semialdehyde dehydrogenase [Pseudobdellovibrionaceae bacterium]